MAANSSCRKVAALASGKRLPLPLVSLSQLSHNIPNSFSLSAPSFRRSLNTSVYEKNVEEQVCPAVVPDDIIAPLSDKYWAPNPSTGVFGPPTAANSATAGEGGFRTSPLNAGSESVLEQKAFFRPLEDLDMPDLPN